jgi:hypothetical protein
VEHQQDDEHLHGATDAAAQTAASDDDGTVSQDGPPSPTSTPGTGATGGWQSPPGAGAPSTG